MDNQKIVLSALLIALSVGMGYLFLLVPNVEMVTATVFIAGSIVGPLYGLFVGLLAELIYSAFNPYGMAMPPLLITQVLCFAFIGFVGGLVGKRQIKSAPLKLIILATCGFLLTLLFDVATTLSFALFSAGANMQKIWSTFIIGASFYAVHSLVNTLIFVTIVPGVQMALQRYLKR